MEIRISKRCKRSKLLLFRDYSNSFCIVKCFLPNGVIALTQIWAQTVRGMRMKNGVWERDVYFISQDTYDPDNNTAS